MNIYWQEKRLEPDHTFGSGAKCISVKTRDMAGILRINFADINPARAILETSEGSYYTFIGSTNSQLQALHNDTEILSVLGSPHLGQIEIRFHEAAEEQNQGLWLGYDRGLEKLVVSGFGQATAGLQELNFSPSSGQIALPKILSEMQALLVICVLHLFHCE